MSRTKLKQYKVESLKKVSFSKLWKKDKITHITNEELNELIQLMETGKFDKILSLIRKKYLRRNLDIDGIAIILLFKKIMLYFKGISEEGDISLSIDELKKREKQVKTIQAKIITKIIYAMMRVYSKHEEGNIKPFNELSNDIEKNQNVLDPYFRDWVLMSINISLGMISLNNGEHDSAFNYFSETSSISEKHNWKTRQVDVLESTGISYLLQDELELAIVKFQEAIKLAKEIEHTRGILTNENNLIKCFYEKGDYRKALKCARILNNNAQEAKITGLIGLSLFSIIQSLLELDLNNQIQQYLDELEELTATFPQDNITSYSYRYSKALVLKSSNSFADRIKAQSLLTQLLSDTPIAAIDPKIGFHLADLTLKELLSTSNEELLVEFEQTLDLLKEKASQFKSHSMLVVTYLLESKIALIKTNLDEAQQKLDRALKLAREKNLHRMVFKVSKAYDEFLDERDIWESLKIKEAPLKERLEVSRLDKLVDQAIHRKMEEIEEVPEESIYLFILNDSGLTMYSYDFQEEKVIDDQLVGGFLSAINSFCQEMFSTKGYLERVKYQDYTILMEPFGESCICSYVIKGDSYLASKRLIRLIDEITESPLYADFEEIKNTGLVKFDYEEMKSMITEIF